MSATSSGGERFTISALPTGAFGGKVTGNELQKILESIRQEELGTSAQNLPVLATPDGRVRIADSAEGEKLVAELPRERFAASLTAEREEVRRLDPDGRYWIHTSSDRKLVGKHSGWFINMVNDFEDRYVFYVESEPSGLYEAQLVEPNLDALAGHDHHMISNGRVCLNARWGCSNLVELHGTLAKWILYSGMVRRGLPKPYSE